MFGGSSGPTRDKPDSTSSSVSTSTVNAAASHRAGKPGKSSVSPPANAADRLSPGREKRHLPHQDPPRDSNNSKKAQAGDKKRRSSSVNKAAALIAGARNSLHFPSFKETQEMEPGNPSHSVAQSQQQRRQPESGRIDPILAAPQGSLNNSAGNSLPTQLSTFRVGVTEDRNQKCRRTMEDTHSYIYNFLGSPRASVTSDVVRSPSEQISEDTAIVEEDEKDSSDIIETDDGYFAIFDGHAGTFAAEWCGKKLHLVLEEILRNNPSTPVPILLDQTFCSVDQQLETLPLKNSGCTAVTAILRWENRLPSSGIPSVLASDSIGRKKPEGDSNNETAEKGTSETTTGSSLPVPAAASSEDATTRSRVLYTANVGDARVVLCRGGKALRLSYDHKGSDENEGIRITNAGGLILNNRVNGVLAVTRALGDSYMKDLVTGHPFTTETVIQPALDEFIILACDGLWDVCSDQEAVDLVRNTADPQAASKILVDYALSRFSTDNLSCMIVRLNAQGPKPPLSAADDVTEEVKESTSEPISRVTSAKDVPTIEELKAGSG